MLSLIVSCATPPDIYVCTQVSPSRGWCTKTISNTEQYWDDQNKINDKTFFEAKPSMVMLPVESWVKLKAYIIKSCKDSGKCDKSIPEWDRKIQSVDNKVQNLGVLE